MSSIVELIYNHSINNPNKLFIVDSNGTETTYAQAWNSICKIASTLKNIYHVLPTQRVMVECNQNSLYLLACFACELIEAIYIPTEANSSADTLTNISIETDSSLWIYQHSTHPLIKSISFNDLLNNIPTEEMCSMPTSDRISQILFTTGTTGKSKGIAISNKANIALAENIMYGTNMQPDNVEIIPLPISHSHGLRCCFANILAGGTIVLINGLTRIDIFFQLLDKYKVTSIDISPNAATILLKLAKDKIKNYAQQLRYIQIGTAKLSEALKDELVSTFPNTHLYNFYGSTESGRSCVLDFSLYTDKPNCIGLPTINSHIIFTDSNKQIINASSDNPGLLASSGPMNMDYYWNADSLTNEVLVDGYIYTNDLGYTDDQGFVYLLGRNNDVINFNGIKIAPEEIESIAVQYSSVTDACCIPIITEAQNQIPKLFISVDPTNFNMTEFRSFLSKHIDSNKLPKQIEITSQIPRSTNGKLLRNKLK